MSFKNVNSLIKASAVGSSLIFIALCHSTPLFAQSSPSGKTSPLYRVTGPFAKITKTCFQIASGGPGLESPNVKLIVPVAPNGTEIPEKFEVSIAGMVTQQVVTFTFKHKEVSWLINGETLTEGRAGGNAGNQEPYPVATGKFEEFSWVAPELYKGMVQIYGHECRLYAAPQTTPAASNQKMFAYIDSKTQWPVALVTGAQVYLYEITVLPPGTTLPMPSGVKAEAAMSRARLIRSTTAP